MEGVLWYLLASSRGAGTRSRIVRALEERPRNANQLATDLELDYTTVRHHLDVMMDDNLLRRSDDDYGAVYLFTEQARANWDTVEEVLATVEPTSTSSDSQPSTPTETHPEPEDDTTSRQSPDNESDRHDTTEHDPDMDTETMTDESTESRDTE